MPNHRDNARSVSFPTKSYPTVLGIIEEELKKLQSLEASPSSSKAEAICFALSSFRKLCMYIEVLLSQPLTQQNLSKDETCVGEFVDISLRFLDVCSSTRDAIVSMKETARELQSALRRKRGDGLRSIESNVNAYIISRTKLRKETSKSIKALKQIGGMLGNYHPRNTDRYLSAVLRVLREASIITSSIFGSLLLFLSVPMAKPKPGRWYLVKKWVHKGVIACEGQDRYMNELEMADIAVNKSSKDFEAEKMQSKLETLDVSLEGLENELDCLFRHLIHTRVNLLNVLSY